MMLIVLLAYVNSFFSAKLLAITPSALIYWMQKYNIGLG